MKLTTSLTVLMVLVAATGCGDDQTARSAERLTRTNNQALAILGGLDSASADLILRADTGTALGPTKALSTDDWADIGGLAASDQTLQTALESVDRVGDAIREAECETDPDKADSDQQHIHNLNLVADAISHLDIQPNPAAMVTTAAGTTPAEPIATETWQRLASSGTPATADAVATIERVTYGVEVFCHQNR